ncbi:CBS domain-containing protein [Phytohabitans sp. ZYX-F-186]|uniref:CBS domain-containing protein n=1 Tax=Phytohabitans maris TaxID=3071409 RepID=A0ABU0ZMQ4_9ACTN|nr:CBS domain-containing protein [Phytohabitans sp. ZYX-F-186]MDQ7908324.1 CBS domain-containing protein [Phytohabitans sp. ZYX-F-186]
MAQKVRDLMTPHPVTLPPDASLVEAAKQMRAKDIGDVLVVGGDGRLRGIVTDRDIVVRALADDRDAGATTLGEVCSPDLAVLGPEDDTDEAVDVMRERAVRRIPVIDGGELMGVLSLGDVAIERDSGSVLADISAARENT